MIYQSLPNVNPRYINPRNARIVVHDISKQIYNLPSGNLAKLLDNTCYLQLMYQFEMAMFHSYVSLLEGSAFNNLPNSEWYTIYTIYRYHMLMILLHNTSMIIYKKNLQCLYIIYLIYIIHMWNIYLIYPKKTIEDTDSPTNH